jgi:hypothetical protein
MSRIVYKALKSDGTSVHQGWKWPLPGQPGEWVEVEGKPELCKNGLHGYHTLEQAERLHEGASIYEMEVDGQTVEDTDKLAATRARLVRLVSGEEDRRERELESALRSLLDAVEGSHFNKNGKTSMREEDALLVARIRLGLPGRCRTCGGEHGV